MEFNVKHGAPETIETGCLVVSINESSTLTGTAAHLDNLCGGRISAAVKQGDIAGQSGQTLMLFDLPGIAAQRVLLIGSGDKPELGDRDFRKLLQKAVAILKNGGATDAVLTLSELPVKGRDLYSRARLTVETIRESLYQFDQYKSKKADKPRLQTCNLLSADQADADAPKQTPAHLQFIHYGSDPA